MRLRGEACRRLVGVVHDGRVLRQVRVRRPHRLAAAALGHCDGLEGRRRVKRVEHMSALVRHADDVDHIVEWRARPRSVRALPSKISRDSARRVCRDDGFLRKEHDIVLEERSWATTQFVASK